MYWAVNEQRSQLLLYWAVSEERSQSLLYWAQWRKKPVTAVARKEASTTHPVTVIDDDSIGCRQVDAQSSSPSAEQEDKLVRVRSLVLRHLHTHRAADNTQIKPICTHTHTHRAADNNQFLPICTHTELLTISKFSPFALLLLLRGNAIIIVNTQSA